MSRRSPQQARLARSAFVGRIADLHVPGEKRPTKVRIEGSRSHKGSDTEYLVSGAGFGLMWFSAKLIRFEP